MHKDLKDKQEQRKQEKDAIEQKELVFKPQLVAKQKDQLTKQRSLQEFFEHVKDFEYKKQQKINQFKQNQMEREKSEMKLNLISRSTSRRRDRSQDPRSNDHSPDFKRSQSPIPVFTRLTQKTPFNKLLNSISPTAAHLSSHTFSPRINRDKSNNKRNPNKEGHSGEKHKKQVGVELYENGVEQRNKIRERQLQN